MCTWLAQGDGQLVVMMWPSTFRARFDPLELLDDEGHVVARGGEFVTVTGGYLKLGDPRSLGYELVFAAWRFPREVEATDAPEAERNGDARRDGLPEELRPAQGPARALSQGAREHSSRRPAGSRRTRRRGRAQRMHDRTAGFDRRLSYRERSVALPPAGLILGGSCELRFAAHALAC